MRRTVDRSNRLGLLTVVGDAGVLGGVKGVGSWRGTESDWRHGDGRKRMPLFLARRHHQTKSCNLGRTDVMDREWLCPSYQPQDECRSLDWTAASWAAGLR